MISFQTCKWKMILVVLQLILQPFLPFMHIFNCRPSVFLKQSCRRGLQGRGYDLREGEGQREREKGREKGTEGGSGGRERENASTWPGSLSPSEFPVLPLSSFNYPYFWTHWNIHSSSNFPCLLLIKNLYKLSHQHKSFSFTSFCNIPAWMFLSDLFLERSSLYCHGSVRLSLTSRTNAKGTAVHI